MHDVDPWLSFEVLGCPETSYEHTIHQKFQPLLCFSFLYFFHDRTSDYHALFFTEALKTHPLRPSVTGLQRPRPMRNKLAILEIWLSDQPKKCPQILANPSPYTKVATHRSSLRYY